MSNSFLERIRPYLLSDQTIVQDFVLHTLKEYPFTPAEWTNKLLEMALHSEDKRTDLLIWGNSKAVNENTIPILLNLLEVTEVQKRHLVIGYFTYLHPETVLKHELELSPIFKDEIFSFYRFLMKANQDELQSEYTSVLSLLEKEQYYNHPLYIRAKQIQDRLIFNQWLDASTIDQIMESELEQPFFSYKGILAIRAIGLLKIDKYISILAGLLERNEDILLEETAEALSLFQSEEVVEAVAPYAMNDDTSIFAVGILANTKNSKAENALYSSYPDLDEEGKAMVLEGLAQHLSEKALPLIDDYMRNGYSNMMFDVESLYYGLYTVLGKNHPMMGEWLAAYKEKEEHFKQESLNIPVLKAAKVGRNEKCPCGSGKKYKKCCGA